MYTRFRAKLGTLGVHRADSGSIGILGCKWFRAERVIGLGLWV